MRPPRSRSVPPGILLVGTPGCGKRSLAHLLSVEAGYVHLDLDRDEVRDSLLRGGRAALRAALAGASTGATGLVLTWSAAPGDQIHTIRSLRAIGFDAVWFDGDRGSTCAALYGVRDARLLRFVDTFAADGSFRPLAAVLRELQPARRAPVVHRLRRARPMTPNARTAGGARTVGLAGRVSARAALLVGAVAAAVGSLAVGGRSPAWLGFGGASTARPALALASAHPPVARAVATLSQPGAAPETLAKRSFVPHIAVLPRVGVLVPGKSLAGIRLGDSMARVRSLWGQGWDLARCSSCEPTIWVYRYQEGLRDGAGVQFDHGRVVGVFTIGSPSGWHTQTGLRVGQQLAPPTVDDQTVWRACAGLTAATERSGGNAVTSILTSGRSIYGFALTRPRVSPCRS